jgi:ubiquinone/menaquinone biosynthesis C-methylase UbiE
LSDTYSDVDRSPDAHRSVAWQDRVDAWPQIRAYKERSYELCGDAVPRLDVGAGPGTDAAALAAFACDPSIVMCETASSRGVPVVRADAHALPFADGTFGAVRTDRVIQHVADPVRAVAEMTRICARGGRVVICDPDQETLVIHVAEVRDELVEKVRRLRRDRGYRNGKFVRRIPALLAGAGLQDVIVEAFPLVLTNPEDAFGLPGWPRYWAEHFSEAEVAEWEHAVREHREGAFIYALLYFVVAGTRP